MGGGVANAESRAMEVGSRNALILDRKIYFPPALRNLSHVLFGTRTLKIRVHRTSLFERARFAGRLFGFPRTKTRRWIGHIAVLDIFNHKPFKIKPNHIISTQIPEGFFEIMC